MPIDITPIIEAVIALLAAIITYKLIPWIKARTSAEQQATLGVLIRTLVYAAEQMYGTGAGEAKLAYVEDELLERGYKVDRAAIEAAVRELTAEMRAAE